MHFMYIAAHAIMIAIAPISMNEAVVPLYKKRGWKRKKIAHVSQMGINLRCLRYRFGRSWATLSSNSHKPFAKSNVGGILSLPTRFGVCVSVSWTCAVEKKESHG